jgi:PIN domain nuclease of toxin-antitoxin system
LALISDLGVGDRLVLDTHIWVWVSGEAGGLSQFANEAVEAIEDAARGLRLFASAASVWELALKLERGQAIVSSDLRAWVRDQWSYPVIRVMPIDAKLAMDSTALPPWIRSRDGKEHRDPGDRFIVATARRLNGILITCDEKILEYAERGHVRAFDAR